MECRKCKGLSIKNGKVKSNGKQRFVCKICRISFVEEYSNNACRTDINNQLIVLTKEGVGIRGIARILKISPTTVLERILVISAQIKKPPIPFGRSYEVDEMMTFIGNKNNRICVTYALDRKTRDVVSFSVGRRNQRTLRQLVNTLILSEAKEIRTDKCPLYPSLIPPEIHHVKQRGINYIERKNLTLRTHLKRLNRRTLAYSKSLLVLSAILKIYFFL